MDAIRNFIQEEDGVTAIEYGLIAALVAVAIIAGATLLGTSLNDLLQRIGDCIAAPTGGACALVA
jgi:pilus assembly protein Flp/PilA